LEVRHLALTQHKRLVSASRADRDLAFLRGEIRVLDGQDVATRLDTGRPVTTGRFVIPQFDASAIVGGTIGAVDGAEADCGIWHDVGLVVQHEYVQGGALLG
jgi:hypothetical protein